MSTSAKSSKRHVRVLKFGGSSVGDPSAIRRVVDVIGKSARRQRVIVVVSALSQVTNTLEKILQENMVDRTALLLGLYRRHIDTAAQLLSSSELTRYRIALGEQLASIIPSLRRVAQRVQTHFDEESIRAAGERFSVPLIAASLRESGFSAEPVDGSSLISVGETTDTPVDLGRTNDQIQSWYQSLPTDQIPIVTGFIGSSRCGNTVTLGRGGSDFTAALIASALKAELMERWTDVDGLYTNDPNGDRQASRYTVLRMEEAEMLNSANRLGMHLHTLTPLMASRVPLRVRSIHSSGAGTLVIPTDDVRHKKTISC